MRKTKKYKDHLLKELKDPEEASEYLNACLDDEDPCIFLLALKDVAEANGGMRRLSHESSLNRQTLYRTLSKSGNPKMKSILSILGSLGLEFYIRPTHHHTSPK